MIPRHQYVFLAGSNPILSAAEVVTFFKRIGKTVVYSNDLQPAGLVVETSDPLDTEEVIANLGGTPVIIRIHGTLSGQMSVPSLFRTMPQILSHIPERNPIIGLSWFALSDKNPRTSTKDARGIGMEIKRYVRQEHEMQRIRMVLPRKGSTLSTAQMFHAGIPKRGAGIVLFERKDGGKRTITAGTVEAIQDISLYAERDRGRPSVDPGRGMMPPKLAQIMANLSLVPPNGTIYDPFCGTGTIPMEALLMDHPVIASDRSEKQIERTRQNLLWVKNHFPPPNSLWKEHTVFTHDITTATPVFENGVDAVVTEGWLGPPQTAQPTHDAAQNIFRQVRRTVTAALSHLLPLLQSNGHIVLCLPAFRAEGKVIRTPFTPQGWKTVAFDAPRQQYDTLLYGRSNAIVLREIIRLRPGENLT